MQRFRRNGSNISIIHNNLGSHIRIPKACISNYSNTSPEMYPSKNISRHILDDVARGIKIIYGRIRPFTDEDVITFIAIREERQYLSECSFGWIFVVHPTYCKYRNLMRQNVFLRFNIKPMAQDSEQHLALSTDGNVIVGHRNMVQREPSGQT